MFVACVLLVSVEFEAILPLQGEYFHETSPQ